MSTLLKKRCIKYMSYAQIEKELLPYKASFTPLFVQILAGFVCRKIFPLTSCDI